MKIEKRYLDSDFSKDSEPDEVFDSLGGGLSRTDRNWCKSSLKTRLSLIFINQMEKTMLVLEKTVDGNKYYYCGIRNTPLGNLPEWDSDINSKNILTFASKEEIPFLDIDWKNVEVVSRRV